MSLTDDRIRAFLARQRERENSESQAKLINLLPIACEDNDSAMQSYSKDDTIASLNNCIKIPEVQNESDYSINLDKSKRDEPSGLHLNLNDLKVRPEFIKFNTPCASPSRNRLRQDAPQTARPDLCLPSQGNIQPFENYILNGIRAEFSKNEGTERSSIPLKSDRQEKGGQIDRYLARSQLMRAKARENSMKALKGKKDTTGKTSGGSTRREGREGGSPCSPPRQPRQNSSQDLRRSNSIRKTETSAKKNKIPPIENFHKIGSSSPKKSSARSDTSSKGNEVVEIKKLIRKGKHVDSTKGISSYRSRGTSPEDFHGIKTVNDLNFTPENTKRSGQGTDRKPPKSAATKNTISFQSSRRHSQSKELETTTEESMLKKEVRALIDTIKLEKDKIFHDMNVMSSKLTKYKSAYKRVKKQLALYQAKGPQDQGEETLNTQREKDESGSKTPLVTSRSGLSRKHPVEDVEAFTIDVLELTPRKTLRASQNNLRDKKLYDCIENLNFDVEKLVTKTPLKQGKLWEKAPDAGMKAFEFDKNPLALSVVKELQLDVRVFNRDQEKTPRDIQSGGDLSQICMAQKEIIKYLYSKLLHEEKQRLETEEQAHLMISTMEKSVSQMEGRLKAYEAIPKKQDNTGLSSVTAEGDASRVLPRE